jgi:hypothetical protein
MVGSRARFTVIDGGRAELELKLVKLLLTPGPTPSEDYRRLMARLEPRYASRKDDESGTRLTVIRGGKAEPQPPGRPSKSTPE